MSRRHNEDGLISKRSAIFIIIICAIIIFLVVSSMDARDESEQYIHYCEMVLDGDWPNYKKIDCSTGDGL